LQVTIPAPDAELPHLGHPRLAAKIIIIIRANGRNYCTEGHALRERAMRSRPGSENQGRADSALDTLRTGPQRRVGASFSTDSGGT
jgi:hypothetical protein